jgi:hypothetical protein
MFDYSELLLHEFKEVLESLSPLKFIENNSVKLEILRTMRPNYADKGRCIIKEGETTGGVVFLITGRAIITKSRLTRKSYTGDTSSPHTARRRGPVADLTSGMIIISVILSSHVILFHLISYYLIMSLVLSHYIHHCKFYHLIFSNLIFYHIVFCHLIYYEK